MGGYRKLRRMTFALAEGLKRVYRSWMRGAITVNLLRDERHSRLLVRFRCADSEGVRHVGVLGQSRIVHSTATQITMTTKEMLDKFCTQNYGLPDSDHAPINDPELYDHIRTSIHALTVDAAGNEIAAGENMMSASSSTAHAVDEEAWAPNMTIIVRDKAHASRRVLHRPWVCDEYLSAVANALILDSGSVAQLIEHSADLRAWYEEASVKSCERLLSSTFSQHACGQAPFRVDVYTLEPVVSGLGGFVLKFNETIPCVPIK